MSDIRKLHNKAMLHFQNALVLEFNNENAQKEYELAFNYEKKACKKLLTNEETRLTKNILLRSAASLAYKCGKIEKCRNLIIECENNKPNERIKDELKILNNLVNGK
ncbi:hypothetical protein KY334_07165 [Candidatus Woesearchaeota archaeon]|nr:hypothetical protein [Candidatus Woesearchaeota archaeon]